VLARAYLVSDLTATCCFSAGSSSISPQPLLHWDASSLYGMIQIGQGVDTWPSTGTNTVTMHGKGVGPDGQPTLELDPNTGAPYVNFRRNGQNSYGWFEAGSSITFAAPADPSTPAGITIIFVARLHTVVDEQSKGAAWEHILSFGNSMTDPSDSIHVRRYLDYPYDMVYEHYEGSEKTYWRMMRDAWTGRFAVYTLRLLGNDLMFRVNRIATNMAAGYNDPIKLPRTMSQCFIGRSGVTPEWNTEIYLNGGISDLLIYDRGLADTELDMVYQQLRSKTIFTNTPPPAPRPPVPATCK
jgi:hypothetical protein